MAELRKKNASLKGELVAFKVSYSAVEVEVESNLKQMKTLAVDATLHARADLLEEYIECRVGP